MGWQDHLLSFKGPNQGQKVITSVLQGRCSIGAILQPPEGKVDQAVLVATLKFTVKSFIFSDDTQRLHCLKKANITLISTIFCDDIGNIIFYVCM